MIGQPYNNSPPDKEYVLSGDDAGRDDETVRVGPAGIDDPETEWEIDESGKADPLPTLTPRMDEIWLLLPGGESLLLVTTICPDLPQARLDTGSPSAPGEICSLRRAAGHASGAAHLDRRRRPTTRASRWLPSGCSSCSSATARPGSRTRPRKYVIVTGAGEELLGWLDYSDALELRGPGRSEMVEAVGLAYEIERDGAYLSQPIQTG